MLQKAKVKIKPLTEKQIKVALDRLTRFKEPEIKYLRVFREIVNSNLIEPKVKSDELSPQVLKEYAETIINFSLESLGLNLEDDFKINEAIFENENRIFNIDPSSQLLLNNKINYKAAIDNKILDKKIPFAVKKLILAEGITEEILLPEFAKLCGFDFEKNGIFLISAGGKNQVVKYFYKYSQCLRIPVFVLFDNDAQDNLKEIEPKLREFDKVCILSGEFEDLLPIPLIAKTLNYLLKNFYKVNESELQYDMPMSKILGEFFKAHGLSEFKKADFAQAVKAQLLNTKISPDSEEIFKIIQMLAV